MSFLLFLSSTLASILATAQASSFSTATISAGTINGIKCANSDATSFLTIPFAKPPVGELRFTPPQPYGGQFAGGILNATVPAPSCIQFGTFGVENGPTSEDCLFLDVYVPPNTKTSSGLPVKVFIYGGAESSGGISDPLYKGCNLAKAGAVFVTINYRLGPLGFLALESAGIAGNFGIQDILLGLQWVQDNIAAFGGDPDKVLLFGQSAGSVNVYNIATLPQAPTLFKAAISESGGGRDAPLTSAANALGVSYAKTLGCDVSDISCFRSKSAFELNASYPEDSAIGVGSELEGFGLFVDGTVIPAQPSEAGVKVPAVFGFNADDGSLFVLAAFKDPKAITAANYTTFLENDFGSAAPLVENKYPLSAFNSSPLPAFYAIDAVVTDYSYKCPAWRALNRGLKNGVPTWTYRFAHTPTCPWVAQLPVLALGIAGAAHIAEVPFVFGNVFNLLLPNGTCNLNAEEQRISADLVSAWTAMAATGDPSTESVEWPAYSPSTSLGLNILNSTTAGSIDFSMCEFWEPIYAAQLKNNTLDSMGSSNTTGAANGSVPSGTPSAGVGPATFTGGVASVLVGYEFLYALIVVMVLLA